MDDRCKTTYRVIGVCADGNRELCAALVGLETAETIAALERKIRGHYRQVLVEPDGEGPKNGALSKTWRP